MARKLTYTLRLNRDERRKLRQIARQLDRTDADTLRHMIRTVAHELQTEQRPETAGEGGDERG